jgi:ribonuclease HII
MKTGNPLIDNSTAEWVLGSDEVGYGSWAGPLLVCATLVHRSWSAPGVGDSKGLTPKKREQAFERYSRSAPHHVVWVDPERIDQMGVYQALLAAHREALEALLPQAKSAPLIVVDGFPNGTVRLIGVPGAIGIPKGDQLIPAISLASIIAKVTHDRHMAEQAKTYPHYGFSTNMGYNSPQHQVGLAERGPCPIHRRSYAPVAKSLERFGSLAEAEGDVFL